MKIVYIIDALAITGGLERILIDKMNYLANEYNYEIYLITTIQGEHPFIFPLSSKIKHIDLNTAEHKQYNYKYPKRFFIRWKFEHSIKICLQNHINKIQPDIIIGTTKYKADIICKLKSKAKRIIESHLAKSFTGDNEGIKRSPIIQLVFNLNLSRYNHIIKKYSDAIVTLTKGDAIEWGEPHKTYVIPNVITQIATTLSSCENKKVIAVGRLTHQKGFDILIKVWKKVIFKFPKWKLNIYGDGDIKNDLILLIENEGLNNNITIYPPTTQIYKKMQDSSILVFSSRCEGFGLVLIEAMTNGLPCVSFDCPYGPSDIITDGEDGFLIHNGDIQAMTDKICYLIENENIRKQMGQKAHQSAMRYAPENIMPMWDNFFNEIIKS